MILCANILANYKWDEPVLRELPIVQVTATYRKMPLIRKKLKQIEKRLL